MTPRRLRSLVAVVMLLTLAACTEDPAKAKSAAPATAGDVPTTPAPESPSTAPEPATLLPNLRSLPAERVSIRRTNDGREIRFAGILANVGTGPLVVRPDNEAACRVGQRHASQVLFADTNGTGAYEVANDGEVDSITAGCMLDHPTHKHWHFDAMARYALHRPGDDQPIVAADKVSFCLRDSRRVAGAVAAYPQRYRGCTRTSVQGISVGWADVYRPSLPGQALPLPDDLADATYCLFTEADPDRLLRETDEDDNAAVIGVYLTSSGVDVVAVPPDCAALTR